MRSSRGSHRLVPAMVSFAETASRQDCWGMLDALAPGGAMLSTRFKVERGERLFLTMRLGEEEFSRIAALAAAVRTDRDGYRLAELRFTDEVQKRRLAKVLLDLLAT
ncbi:MAG: PilZ domain-containing protein [Elusimicrobia bacterium]|nr:PilZ domain-containing protein [Elusimicrobiota bacterium]